MSDRIRQMRVVRFSTILFGSFAFFGLFQLQAEWTSWRGKDGLGISDESGWDYLRLENPDVQRWKTNVGIGWSSVASIDNHLYTMGNQDGEDTVYCLNSDDGSVVWEYTYEEDLGDYPGPRATPVVDENRVYTVSRNARVFCFERESGQVLWSRDLKNDLLLNIPTWGICGSPVVLGDLLFLNVGQHGAALDKTSGKEVWTSGRSVASGYASPVLYNNGESVVISGSDHIYGVNSRTGEQLWSHPFGNRWDINACDPIVYDHKLFITAEAGAGSSLLELSGEKLKLLWEKKDLQMYFSSPIYYKGYLYGPTGQPSKDKDCTLVCVNAITGEIAWSEKKGFSSIIIVDGKIIALNQAGELSVIEANPEGYHELVSSVVIESSRKGPAWTAPVLDEGLLYCRNGVGDLVCLDLRKP